MPVMGGPLGSLALAELGVNPDIHCLQIRLELEDYVRLRGGGAPCDSSICCLAVYSVRRRV